MGALCHELLKAAVWQIGVDVDVHRSDTMSHCKFYEPVGLSGVGNDILGSPEPGRSGEIATWREHFGAATERIDVKATGIRGSRSEVLKIGLV